MSAEVLRQAADELDRLYANGTQGAWKLWGMQVLADQDGTSNVDTAVPVASTFCRNEDGKPRTWDATLIAALHNATPALAEWLRAQAATWESDHLLNLRQYALTVARAINGPP